MAEQLWKGRFSKAVDSRVNDFNSSIRFDQRMIAQDMRGSGVHAAMLARQGIISEQDCADILSGLASIADDLSSGALTIDPPPRTCTPLWSRPDRPYRGCGQAAAHRPQPQRSGGAGYPPDFAGLQQDFAGLYRGAGAGAVQKGSGEHRLRHARLHPPAACPAHHLRPRADGLCFHAAARP